MRCYMGSFCPFGLVSILLSSGSYCFESSWFSSSRLGSPRFGLSLRGAFRFGSGSPPLCSFRFGTGSDLELQLVERPARFDSNQLWAS